MGNMYIKCVNFFVFKSLFYKMCNFVNLLLKLNIYVFSSRLKKIINFLNDIFSFLKKSFKD